ncbi:HAD family hydrolase [Oscillibacter valericigenes]|nr:HAD family hydrolase [Oscillibacter valericigenes]
MRLQSAIFTLPDALYDGGTLRAGADKVLSILKMESVWLYAVTALSRTDAEKQLRAVGLEGYFRGTLTEEEAGCAVTGEAMLEKAMRRLRSQKADTVVFTGTLAGVESAKAAGFRAVAVGGAAGEDEWRRMRALADYELSHYEDWLRLE